MNFPPSSAPVAAPCCPLLAGFCAGMALIVTVATLAGSLYLSIGVGLQACPLCFMERTLLMGVLVVLLGGRLIPALRQTDAIPLLALPLAAAGLGVAGFHVWLEVTGVLVCPYGLMQLGTAPVQALASFVLLNLFLIIAVLGVRPPPMARGLPGVLIALAAGGLLTFASIRGGSRLPPAKLTFDEAITAQAKLELEGCNPIKRE